AVDDLAVVGIRLDCQCLVELKHLAPTGGQIDPDHDPVLLCCCLWSVGGERVERFGAVSPLRIRLVFSSSTRSISASSLPSAVQASSVNRYFFLTACSESNPSLKRAQSAMNSRLSMRAGRDFGRSSCCLSLSAFCSCST